MSEKSSLAAFTPTSHPTTPTLSRAASNVSTPGLSANVNAYQDPNYRDVIEGLRKVYNHKIKPLEVTYNFEAFHSSPLTYADISAKPLVLLIGQYSTGKTTFIKYLIENDYPGEHIGVEPTTDRFVAVMHGDEDRVIPGNAAAVDVNLPFRSLNRFGQAFLSRFQVSQTNSPVLENMTFIDTPGVLAGDKQTIDRGYDFTAAVEYFAERADMVILLFDCNKLDISNEFKSTIRALRGQEEKVKVVLNKSDMVSQQELMRVYGAMMWSLGKVVQTPEVMRVYIGSFWTEKPSNCLEDNRALIDAEHADLLKDLRDLPKNSAMRKINTIVKRARLAKVHACIVGQLKNDMPAMFGKKKKQQELIANLDKTFLKIQQRYHLSPGDFPNVERFKSILSNWDLDKFKSLKPEMIQAAEDALANDLPKLIAKFPQGNRELSKYERNPFETFDPPADGSLPPSYFHYRSIDIPTYQPIFNSLEPRQGKVSGAQARPILMETGLAQPVLAHIWRLSDWDDDGYLTFDEFAVAMHLAKAVQNGAQVPDTLPAEMRPNRRL